MRSASTCNAATVASPWQGPWVASCGELRTCGGSPRAHSGCGLDKPGRRVRSIRAEMSLQAAALVQSRPCGHVLSRALPATFMCNLAARRMLRHHGAQSQSQSGHEDSHRCLSAILGHMQLSRLVTDRRKQSFGLSGNLRN